MCGICGKLNFDKDAEVQPQLVKAMANNIAHRGPDDEGFYFSGQIGLGFRRLSIIDLGGGHQPLSNEDGTVWIVFNGEIYNYQELRQFLLSKGHKFKTQTDTEVIVHLYEELGEACLERLRGMFAFAVWDNRNKSLFIARDRVGIKPLYYATTAKGIIFGSEIKSILVDPEVEPQISREMIDRFLTFLYMPGDKTLLQNVYKLQPGSYIVVQHGQVKIRPYWDLNFHPGDKSLEQAKKELLDLLEESVRLHMISDVPVGFLLSGGVDSTAMLSLAAGKTDRPISSYTVGFSEPGMTDERPYAQLAASRYRSKHHEMTISSRDFADFLPKYIWHMEEPVCEPPAVALFYVSKLAREFVKVLISGEGGDEAFAGYPNYRSMLWLERFKRVAGPLAGPAANLLRVLGLSGGAKLKRYLPLVDMPFESYYYSRTSTPFSFFNREKESLYAKDFQRFVNNRVSTAPVAGYLKQVAGKDTLSKMLYVDSKTWLPDDLLIKADKMTMANSIELRVPFLDHKVLEFAAMLPPELKVHGFTTKYIARETLRKQVPQEILDRKKAGFPVPYENWLRTDLWGWMRDILLDRETVARGYFNRNTIESLIAANSNGVQQSKELFSLVVLELWHREFLNRTKFRQSRPVFDPTASVPGRN